MTTTTNLALKKPDADDFYNVGDFNENADIIDTAVGNMANDISGKAAKSHTHTSADITGLAAVATSGKYIDLSGKPTSLPANGGNADTVDGKHAADFALKTEIPTTLPANGGNADTVDNKHASDFMQNLGFLNTGSLLDYVLTMTDSGYLFVTGNVTDTPISGQFFFVDVRRYAGGHYAITATRFNAGGVYTNRYNNNSDMKKWYGWANVADGGNAATANTAGTLSSTASNICLRNLSSGTAAATTANCPAGAWYGKHA